MAAAAILMSLAAVVPGRAATNPAATPDGFIDQQIAPLPNAQPPTPCDALNFPGYVVVGPTKSLEQEFVPSVGGLASISLCVNILTPGTTVRANIRNGTATNVGAVLDRGSASSPLLLTTGVQLVTLHFFTQPDFSDELATTPGQKYVLEVPPSNVTYRWMTTCGVAADPANNTIPVQPCPVGSTDRYTQGDTNFTAVGVGDFGFRSLLGHPANLTGAVTSVGGTSVLCPNPTTPDPSKTPSNRTLTATISNSGAQATRSFTVSFYVAKDAALTTNKKLIGSTTVSAPAAGSVAATLSNVTIPDPGFTGRGFIGVVVDEGSQVTETDETDNSASSPVTLLCGASSFGALSLTESANDVPPGAYRVPLASIPLEKIGFATTGTESAPTQGFPTQGFALSGTSLSSLPTQGFFSSDAQPALSTILLSEVPVAGGWHQYLVGTPYENVPDQSVTLAQALSVASNVPVGDIDFAHSPLRAATFGGIATARVPLSKISATGPGGQAWCTFFSTRGYDCATYGIDPTRTTLLDLDLKGVKASIPWSTMTFRSMDLSGSPLTGLKLTQLRIRQTPLRLIARSAINNASTFVSCTSCATLGDAEAAGAIVDGPTLAQLIGALSDPATSLGAATLGDVLMGALLDRSDWPVGALALDQSPVYASSGHNVISHLTVPSGGPAPLVDPTITVVPPPGFLLVPGTSKTLYNNVTHTLSREPSSAGGALTWALSGADGLIVDAGTSFELQYTLAPGLVLEYSGSKLSAQADDQFGTEHATDVLNASPIRVADAEHTAGNDNNTADTAPVLATGEKLLGHVDSSTDVDWYRIPVPTGTNCAGTTGAAQPGCRITVTMHVLDDPSVDYDMAIWGPASSSSTQGSPTQGFPTQGFAVSDDLTTVGGTQSSAPETVQDFPTQGFPTQGFPTQGFPTQGFPTQGFPTQGFGATLGTSDEQVEGASQAGESGYYSVEVWGRNGSTGNHPYVLSLSVTPPPALPACTPRTFGTSGVAGSAPTLPSDFKTLILVDQKRMGDIFGAASVGTPSDSGSLMNKLTTFAARPEVNGVVYPIESDSAVASALSTWDTSPCDVSLANQAVSAISALVARVQQGRPGFSSVVIVGTDEVIPMVRIPDITPLDNEDAFTGQLVRSTGNTAVTSAAANRFFLSDDAYGTDAPFTSQDHFIFVPKWTLGRLIETPAQIGLQLDRYVATGGLADQPPNQTALVTGYDFVRDGATAVAAPQISRLGAANVDTLNCNTWTKGDLTNAWFGTGLPSAGSCASATLPGLPDLVSLGGHADNFRFAPPGGTDLVTTADVPADYASGKIIFSVGCHFGLNLPDSIGSATQVPAALHDWADTLAGSHAAVVVGNTGFGYGDSASVALSEKLMQLFSERLDGSRSVGEAFRDAKQEYWLSEFGAYSGFDEKALQEAVLYGLPSFRIAAGGVQASAAFTSTGQSLQSDPVTGLQSLPFDSGSLSFTRTDVSTGSYYSSNGSTLNVDRRPIVPQVSFNASNTDATKPGYRLAGLFVTGVTSSTVNSFDPAIARAEVDSTRPEPKSQGTFPVAPGGVTTFGSQQRLLLWPGKFVPAPSTASTIGKMILSSRETGTLYYTNVVAPAPRIVTLDSEWVDPTHIRFEAHTQGGANPVKRVGVVLGQTFLDLSQASPTDPDRWIGVMTVPATVDLSDVRGEAVSASGLGFWGANGGPLVPTTPGQDSRLAITPSGPSTNGWFTGDVSVSVSSPVGFATQYSLDGGPFQPYLAPVMVSGTAHHLFRATASNTGTGETINSSAQILIDVTRPTVTITSPSGTYALNSTVTPAYACADAGSGILSCSGPSTVDTSSPGTKSYTVTAVDVAGNQQTQTVSYTVAADIIAPTVSITTPADGATYAQDSVVNASYSCADSGGSGLASCTGTVANGAAIDTSTVGAHTFSVTAVDRAGNSTTRSVTYNVPGGRFDGFYSPVSNPPTMNTQTAGNTEPFKWRYYDSSGKEVTDTSKFSFAWRTITCTSPFAEVSPDPYSQSATSNPSFRYDTTNHFFVFNAQTQKAWKGSCRKFVVTLPDRSARFGYLKLT